MATKQIMKKEQKVVFQSHLKRRKGYIYKQKYNRTWEKDPELRLWIASFKTSPYNAECTVCGKTLTAGLSELRRHAQSKKHQDMFQAKKKSRSIAEMMGPSDTLREDVKIAEMKVATFIVEHNISFQAMDHLSDLLTNIFPDSKIASQFQCKHTKIRSIIKNVLARLN